MRQAGSVDFSRNTLHRREAEAIIKLIFQAGGARLLELLEPARGAQAKGV